MTKIDLEDERWMLYARCAGLGTDQFVPDVIEPITEPPWVVDHFCPTCPVRQQCCDFGKATASSGWWGGMLLIDGQQAIRIARGVALMTRSKKAPQPKLSDEDVADIRLRGRARQVTQRVLSEQYNVSEHHIRRVIQGKACTGKLVHRSGEDAGRSKLTWAIVDDIRERAANGTPLIELAREYGIDNSRVSKIVKYKLWNWDREST